MLYSNKVPTKEELAELWESVGWRFDEEHIDHTYTALTNADYINIMYDDDGYLVGLISAITDGWNVWISYCCIHADYENHGFGSQLLQELLEHYEGKRIWVNTSKAADFYAANGFSNGFSSMYKFPYVYTEQPLRYFTEILQKAHIYLNGGFSYG